MWSQDGKALGLAIVKPNLYYESKICLMFIALVHHRCKICTLTMTCYKYWEVTFSLKCAVFFSEINYSVFVMQI